MRRKIKKGMRWCSHCKEIKSVTEFYPNASRRDGLQRYCINCGKICSNKWRKEYFEEEQIRLHRYYLAHVEECRAKDKKRKEEHPEYRREYSRKRREDTYIRIIDNLRSGVCHLIKGSHRGGHILDTLNCSREKLEKHITKQLKPGVRYKEDYGKLWEIDHIKPISCFDLTDKKQFKEAFSYKNLQPLSRSENSSKGSFYRGKRWRHRKYEKESRR